MENKEVVVSREPKRTSKWVIAIIVIFTTIFTILPIAGIAFMFFYFDDMVYTEFKETSNGEIIVEDELKIYGVESFYDEVNNSYYIQGYLENISDEELEYISLEYDVYDKDDVLLGTAYGSLDFLKVDAKWKFKAIYADIDSSEVTKFELSSVEVY